MESAEAPEVIAEDMQEPCSMHCLTRVLAAPRERVRAFFLDQQCRMRCTCGSKEDRTVVNVLPNGELVWMAFERGMMFTTQICVIEHGTCFSEIRVMLTPQPPLLMEFKRSNGTIQFTPPKPIPATVVKAIVKAKAAENEMRWPVKMNKQIGKMKHPHPLNP